MRTHEEYQKALDDLCDCAMEYEEDYDYEENDVGSYVSISDSSLECMKVPLQELIDKETPKKPILSKLWEDEDTKSIYNEDGCINEIVCACPTCENATIYDFEYGKRFNHCCNCGQAIDWGENNDEM